MVGVAQLVRVPDCDFGCRGFESHRPPQFLEILERLIGTRRALRFSKTSGPLAQLVEQETLNLLVLGSSPRRPTTSFVPRPRAAQKSRCAHAKVAELVDALDLGSSGATRESSSLSFRTTFQARRAAAV